MASCHTRGGIIHRVEKGDTILKISKTYRVDLVDILTANPRLDKNHVFPGDRIFVPNVKKQKYVGKKTQASRKSKIRPRPRRIYKKEATVKVSFSWPAKGKVISRFGMHGKKMHNGINILVKPGEEIKAAAKGKVVYDGDGVEGYGNLLILRHGVNLFSVYAYLDRIFKKTGALVKKGQPIARANQDSKKSIFHFEIRRGKRALNPLRHLPKSQ